MSTLCPCQSGKMYFDCCEPYLSKQVLPQHVEQLARSRYTAFTQANIDYIVDTQCEKAARGFDSLSAENWAKESDWQGLIIEDPKEDGDDGSLMLTAKFRYQDKDQCFTEFCQFKRIDGKWFYTSGEMQ